MKIKNLILTVSLIAGSLISNGQERYVGGDISLLPNYIAANSNFKDEEGNKIDLLPYLHELGMNAMRVRLFVDPERFKEDHPNDYDPNACQSLPYIIPLCRDIIENGFQLMLDFHYSDTWADPAKQWIPKAWEGQTDEELVETIYEYTKNTLQTLREEGIVPSFIQPGNEISFGMLWGPYGQDNQANHTFMNSGNASWRRLGNLLESAIKACREECPEAKIVIHTERVAQIDVLDHFYTQMKEMDIDYDVIGLSYYPYFHGKMSQLNAALSSLETNFPEKNIMIVETGYPYAWEIPGTDKPVDYQYTLEGQNDFAKDLVNTLLEHKRVDGLFWWWLEYNAYGSNLNESWYNAPLFDSRTGKATPALKTICSYANGGAGIGNLIWEKPEKDEWYDLSGRKVKFPVSGIYIHNGKTVIVTR